MPFENPPPALPIQVKIKRTPLAGGAATTIEENMDTPARRILRCNAKKTQSIGDQGADVTLLNTGGKYSAWTSGDVIRIEGKRLFDSAYSLLVEGFLSEPSFDPGHEPKLEFTVIGPNSILDLVSLDEDEEFASGTAYTTIFDTIATEYLTGYTRTITADGSVSGSKIVFAKGQKLREVLDFLRRALNAATSQKWEFIVNKNDATKEIKLYKRSTSVLATVKSKHILQGTARYKGSAWDVVNKAQVFGATIAKAVRDEYTSIAHVGYQRLDATGDWAAQPFTADDTPLYSHQVYADRSGSKDPPSLLGYVVRNSDNVSVTSKGFLKRATVLRNTYLTSVANGTDDDGATSTGNPSMPADSALYELVAWDCGAAHAAYYALSQGTTTPAGTHQYKWQGSNDDSAWTDLTGLITMNTTQNVTALTGAPVSYRYYRVMGKRSNTNGFQWWTLDLAEYGNLATDPTNPERLAEDFFDLTTSFTVTGNVTKTHYKTDFGSSMPVAKVVFKHSESTASALINLEVQGSNNNVDWTSLALLSSTTSTVTDTVYVEDDAYRYIRVIVVDTRSGGSAAVTCTGYFVQTYFQTTTWGAPLTGDNMKGSAWTWSVENLVKHPALLDEQTWPAPRLTLIPGRKYWFVYVPQSGASSTQYWDLSYGTDATVGKAAQKSTDSGATWTDVAANATYRHITRFNYSDLEATSEDATSQAKYANLVPGGILYGSLRDDALLSQDQVDKEAAALITARSDVKDRLSVVVRFDPTIDVGSRVTLDPDLLFELGTSGDFDVLEVVHDLATGGRTIMVLNDHPPTGQDALRLVTSAATGRTV